MKRWVIMMQVAIDDLKICPLCNKFFRYQYDDISELKSHLLKTHNVPLIKITADNEVIDGNRRLRAYRELYDEGHYEFENILCEVVPNDKIDTEEKLVIYIVESNTSSKIRKWTSGERMARCCVALRHIGYSCEDIGKIVGCSKNTVYDSITVIHVLDNFLDNNETLNCQVYRHTLNKQIISSIRKLTPEILAVMTDEEKQLIIQGKKSCNYFYMSQEIADRIKNKDDTQSNKNEIQNKTVIKTSTTKARDKPKDNTNTPKSNNDNLLEQIVIARMIFNAAERLRLDTERCLKEVNFYDKADEDSIRIYQRCLEMIDNVRKVIKKKLKN